MDAGLLQSAHWSVLTDLHVYLGGLAGGAFVIAAIADIVDRRRYRDVVRVGYCVAFLSVVPGLIFLIADLGTPGRFLHLLVVPKLSATIGTSVINAGPFHLKPFSPMSVGAWALGGFVLLAFLAALATSLENAKPGRDLSTFKVWVGVPGAFFGLLLAGYPGVLLGATARPLLSGSHWLGALFLAVGASTGGAAIALILSLDGGRAHESVSRVMRVTAFALIVQAVSLVLFVLTAAGPGSAGTARVVAPLLWGPYSPTFWLGAVLAGLVAPLILHFRGAIERGGPPVVAVVSVLILVGGFALKRAIAAAGQAVPS